MTSNHLAAFQELPKLSVLTTDDLVSLYYEIAIASRTPLQLEFALLLLQVPGGFMVGAAPGFLTPPSVVALQPLASFILERGKSVTCTDLQTEIRFTAPPALLKPGIRAAIGAPLEVASKRIGVICGYTRQPRCFRDEEVAVYEAIAKQAAIAIYTAARVRAFERELEQVKTSLTIDPKPLEHATTPCQHNEETLRLATQVFANSSEGIVILDGEGRLLSVNRAFQRITGYCLKEVIGQKLTLLCPDQSHIAIYQDMHSALQAHGSWRGEIWGQRKSGETYPQWFTLHSISNEPHCTIRYIGIFSDITERKLVENRIHHLAHYDALTKLPNRILLQDRIHQALQQAVHHRQCVAILFLNLDHFKAINSNLGHDIGDLLLKAIAIRMTQSVYTEDTVAHRGGDEFIILLPNIRWAQDAALVARKLIAALSDSPFKLYHHELLITPSIGISVYPHDGTNTQDLLNNANIAMHHAKKKGGNTYRFYTAELNATALERLSLENSLQRAIERGELFLHYQPQMEVASGRILGMEVLMRWRHPEKGLIAPTKFIPIAEEIGLIAPLGEWVLRNACLQYRHWQQTGHGGLFMAVNLSARQFQQNHFLQSIWQILQETGMPPSSLELELAESTLMEHTEETVGILRTLNQSGIRIAIDDFGSGWSSFNHLKRFPIRKLKIDAPLLSNMDIDSDKSAIVSAIIAMAHSLRISVAAEGVEHKAQLDFLRQQRCDAVQGYYICPPLCDEAFTEFLKTAQHRNLLLYPEFRRNIV